MTRRRHLPDDDDISAFRQALKAAGVRRIATNQADPGKPKRKDDAQQARRQAAVESNTFATSGRTSDGRVEAVRPSEYLEFSVADLPWRTFSQLKRGQTAWQAGLDLHGYTLEEARLELESFLRDATAQGLRCVLVVHGKAWGTTADFPVLKSHTNAWLREWPGVLAFCSAIEIDGGTGAVYILLRKRGQ
ncbi:Smr/MutS family protein [Halomonas sp. SH5A2]|uniref:Smr/MutS family protein n=1 Tax=Halomonas sp. SH5A2 TaxID=2749040 RepID=UPI00163E8DB3|nr:Smr/MutS family protein [Halomonas sp. SH5A2]QNI03548.1 Smr/MutS family protein [Halomonas sp. SH5A2]